MNLTIYVMPIQLYILPHGLFYYARHGMYQNLTTNQEKNHMPEIKMVSNKIFFFILAAIELAFGLTTTKAFNIMFI